MPGVSVRLAALGDIPRLVELRRQFTFEAEPRTERDTYTAECEVFLTEAITSGHWRIWVAVESDRVVAHLCLALIEKVPRPTRDNRRIGYLTNVYTVPEHRNKGIGSELLATAKEAARRDGVELVVVWPSDESLDFYDRQGFRAERDPLVWNA